MLKPYSSGMLAIFQPTTQYLLDINYSIYCQVLRAVPFKHLQHLGKTLTNYHLQTQMCALPLIVVGHYICRSVCCSVLNYLQDLIIVVWGHVNWKLYSYIYEVNCIKYMLNGDLTKFHRPMIKYSSWNSQYHKVIPIVESTKCLLRSHVC